MRIGYRTTTARTLSLLVFSLAFSSVPPAIAGQSGTPKENEGTRVFKPTEHPYYSGQFHLSGQKATLIGSMQDRAPWESSIDIQVNELTNSGQVIAEFTEGADRYRIVFDRFAAKAPFQDGGIATRIYEHGDSGNGDPLYPKTWLYLGGWGTATMQKNEQVLYKDYDAHFMVMERSRDPKTHEVRYPVKRTLPGGETDPAGMEIDLWVRSKEQNTNNFPPFETFVHLCWDEVTWRSAQ